MEKIISETKSLKGFEIVKLIKGRRRYIIGLIGAGLGYILTNNEVIAILSGALFDAGLGLVEYYFNEYVKLK